MKKSLLFAAIGLVIGLGIGFAVGITLYGKPAAKVATVATEPTVYELWNLTNKERIKVGLAPLPLDQRLNNSAQEKANDETANHYFGHENPTTGKPGYSYIIAENIPGCRGSENLTENINVNDSSSAISAFMASAPHKAALLNSHDTAVGFGVSGNEIVQHFCLDN
jgi:uncharacterized protein YkwD